MLNSSSPLLKIHELTKFFPLGKTEWSMRKEVVKAVDRVNLTLHKGKTLGLVGESGSGKTTVGRMILRLIKPTSGEVIFENRNLLSLSRSEFRAVQPRIQMVFQDPYNTLNPRLNLEQILQEPMKLNRKLLQEDIEERMIKLMKVVGLKDNQRKRFPHEFSGGQRQRIAICRALALNPKLIVCDEAVSALDVSIQAKIINLLMDLQQEFEPAYVFISHDLSVVRLISDTIAVMYLGKLMETGPAENIVKEPLHPYTKALLVSVPDPYSRKKINTLKGEIPGNVNPPEGCRFHTRCPDVMPRCKKEIPALAEIGPGRSTACFLYHNSCEGDK